MPTVVPAADQTKARARYEWISLGIGLGTLIIVALHWVSGGQRAPIFWLLLTNAPVTVYPVLGWYYEKNNHRLLARYAESAYFLGYATTIASLLVIAVQIPQMGDLTANVGVILKNGAAAVLSTVIGLAGMFALRLRVQTREDEDADAQEQTPEAIYSRLSEESDATFSAINEKSTRIVAALDELLAKFESSQTDAITQISSAAGALAGNLEKIDAAAQDVGESLKKLQPKITASDSALESLAGHASKITAGAIESSKAAAQVEATWQAVNTQVTILSTATKTIHETTGQFQKFQSDMSACAQTAHSFSESVGAAQRTLQEQLTMLQQRASQVGNLTDGVKRFIDAANVIAPTINGIVSNLNEVSSLNDRVRQLSGNLNVANEALNGIGKAVAAISTNGGTLSVKTGDLVEQLDQQIHHLQTLAVPLAEFAESLAAVRPKLAELSGDAQKIDKLNGGVERISKALEKLDAQTESSTNRIRELDAVAADLVETEKELHQVIRSRGR